ncbi:Paraquat-inducible protein A [hydrothermal vent metagenome]|uniref:Paraquat-inducible protein A n=1 Tax=hydrothermal vent metagenome TaxID=652676 RepID=A0A3B0Y1X2_9ZZZZ
MRANQLGLASCHVCNLLQRLPANQMGRCPRCSSRVHLRKPASLSTCWALLLAAIVMYFPANLLPIMTVVYLGSGQPDTIMSGVIRLLMHGDWLIALVIFVASVLVPLLKMIVLIYLLTSVHRKSRLRRRERTRLYRITELVGRWSMVDVFVVALLAALVHLGVLADITPGPGARAFAVVVILTMLSAMSFDPRLIWDHEEKCQ